ncbi:zinc finger MYM-type protein 1-like [Aphis craccivora]|uniref:Zinc finger MYM-type protein 1-like n=1 Tax=Aphis craccivora TaxID=307492 RepID=A0A6G0YJF1_APHCR|nr:zinc finger MYM-type protein 1-like [Aphis craccivora]
MASTNCSAERSFSVLKQVNNYLKSTMVYELKQVLALLKIENSLTKENDFEEIIH